MEELRPGSRPLGSILIELNRAVKAFALYPPSHPALRETLMKAYKGCMEVLKDLGEVTFSVKRDGFGIGEREVEVPLSLKGLAKELFYRKVKQITMTERMTPEEWIAFLEVVTERAHGKGGIAEALIRRGVKGLWVNEIRYEEIVDRSVERGKEKGELGVDEEEEAVDEMGGVDAQIEELVKGLQQRFEPEGRREEGELEELLEALEREEDPVRYEGIVRSLVLRGLDLKGSGQWEGLFKILYAFARHRRSRREEALRNSSYQGLRELFDQMVEEECFRRLGGDGEVSKVAGTIVLALGEEMIGPCLDRLVREKGLHSRRRLFNLLVAFGEMARPMVEARLREAEEWYIKRQMISVLGALGNPRSLPVLKGSLDHDDIRVRREAVKALARIGTEEAVGILISFIRSKEQALSLQAITSLGAIRASGAVPHLVSLLNRWGLWKGLYERKREAVKALGSIGDRRALPALRRLLLGSSLLWRRRYNELKVLGVAALASIGGEEVEAILREVMRRSRGDLYHACLSSLERMKG